MNLWVVGSSASSPAGAVAALRDRLGFFPGRPVETWSAGSFTAAWVAHAPDRAGGVAYAEVSPDRLVLWSGHLAGRFARAVVSGDGVTVEADSMGSYPVYSGSGSDRVAWISNNAELLRAATSGEGVSESVVASVVAGGWSLSGDPVWSGVRRCDAGLDLRSVVPMLGRGLDVDAAASDLVDVTRLLMDWPGRPSVVPVTAGRDSRLVLAAAMRAGMPFTTNTGGRPGEPDVDVGRELAAIAGVSHSLIEDDPHGALHSHWRRAAELVTLTTGGTASLADAVGFPHGPREGPLPLWHSGQGGEIARGYYARVRGRTRGALADSLYTVFAARRPGRREPLSAEGEASVRDQISAWVAEVMDAGAAAEDVPDLFYLLKRMGTWAGPTHGAVEFVRDTTSPLWHERMLPHLLALPASDRAGEEFHRRLLERLAPELAAVPGWIVPSSAVQRRVVRGRALVRKAAAQARLRVRARAQAQARGGHRAPRAPVVEDQFAPVLREVRAVVLGDASHPAWAVLNRPRTEALLSSDAVTLDEVSRYYVWRLATVFAARPA